MILFIYVLNRKIITLLVYEDDLTAVGAIDSTIERHSSNASNWNYARTHLSTYIKLQTWIEIEMLY